MNIREEALGLAPYIVEQRRYLHRHPECSFKEKATTAYLATELEKMGIAVQLFPDYFGLVGVIKGSSQGKTVLLRADIDALTIEEKSGVPYQSEVPGIMHACGHDSHSAMLLGAAKLLMAHRSDFQGTVKLLFQSAEESGHGSKYYVEHNIITDADACFALHVMPQLEAGHFALEAGPRMASCTDFIITIEGASAHGSTPHLGHDAIVAASSAIMNIQTLVSRFNNPLQPLVVTIGKIRAGKQFNIICDKVTLAGTIRTFARDNYVQVPKELEKMLQETAAMFKCKAKMDIITDEPSAVNDHPELLALARQTAVELWGDDVLRPMHTLMSSEDFAFIMQRIPGVLGFLGVQDAQSIYPLHSNRFNLDDGNLYKGAGLHAQFALNYLQQGKGGANHV